MSYVRFAAAVAVLVPVLALAWVLGCVVQLLGALSCAVMRWGAGVARLDSAG